MARSKRRTTADKLADTIRTVLDEYGDEIQNQTQNAVEDVTKAAVKAVRANAKASFGTTHNYRYAKGWTSQLETRRYSAQGVVYNKDVPGLPHLLENGHAKRGGGHTEGVRHIAPVEEQIITQFQKELEERI